MSKLYRGLALLGALVGAAVVPAIAQANTVTISGSMEGSIQISNGDWVSGGYAFSVQGSHPAMTVYMENASITFSGNCSNGGTGALTVPLKAGPYSIPANDNGTYPSNDEGSDASFQGSVQASVCGGSGTLDASKGATFSADLQSDNTANQVQVQFHYRDPNAKGKGNYDCTASNYAADVCGASWSGTATVTPSSPSSCTSSPSSAGCGSCSNNSSSSGCNNCSTNSSAAGCNNCSTNSSGAGCNNCSTNSSAAGCSTTTPTTTSTTATPAPTQTVKGAKSKRHKKARRRHRPTHLSRKARRGHGFTD